MSPYLTFAHQPQLMSEVFATTLTGRRQLPWKRDGMTVLVIGARRGLGFELTALMSRLHGDSVAATIRNLSDDGGLRALAPSPALYALDVRSVAQLSALVRALEQCTTIQTLYYVSGVNAGTFADQYEINARAPFRVIDALLPRFARTGSTLCMVNSLAGTSKQIAMFERAHFPMASARCDAASEPAGCAYKKSQKARNDAFRAREPFWRSRGVTAIAIHPGYMRTRMNNYTGKISARHSAEGIRRVCSTAAAVSRGPLGDAHSLLSWEGRRLPW